MVVVAATALLVAVTVETFDVEVLSEVWAVIEELSLVESDSEEVTDPEAISSVEEVLVSAKRLKLSEDETD
ncbi:hypothetical protein R5Q06_05685 [Oenococcus oeni]